MKFAATLTYKGLRGSIYIKNNYFYIIAIG